MAKKGIKIKEINFIVKWVLLLCTAQYFTTVFILLRIATSGWWFFSEIFDYCLKLE